MEVRTYEQKDGIKPFEQWFNSLSSGHALKIQKREKIMALTRSFREIVKERAMRDPEFRIGLLTEAIECVLNDEINVAKVLLRDYVNATVGFQELGILTQKDPKSLMRMLSPRGNPSLKNISSLLVSLKEHEGVKLHVRAAR